MVERLLVFDREGVRLRVLVPEGVRLRVLVPDLDRLRVREGEAGPVGHLELVQAHSWVGLRTNGL